MSGVAREGEFEPYCAIADCALSRGCAGGNKSGIEGFEQKRIMRLVGEANGYRRSKSGNGAWTTGRKTCNSAPLTCAGRVVPGTSGTGGNLQQGVYISVVYRERMTCAYARFGWGRTGCSANLIIAPRRSKLRTCGAPGSFLYPKWRDGTARRS